MIFGSFAKVSDVRDLYYGLLSHMLVFLFGKVPFEYVVEMVCTAVSTYAIFGMPPQSRKCSKVGDRLIQNE